MVDTCDTANRQLRDRLSDLTCTWSGAAGARMGMPKRRPDAAIRVVITANEINDQHGTGPLVQRACAGWENVFCIRTRNDWGGRQSFGEWNVCLPQGRRSRAQSFDRVLSLLQGRRVDKVLCVPFLPDEFITAIAVTEAFDAKLGVYIMDDQNIAVRNVDDALVGECLRKASLRLATHPELCLVYERKYGLPFDVLPAVVPAGVITQQATTPAVIAGQRRRGAMIGSFWDQHWFDRFCSVVERCDCEIDWFGNNHSPWFTFSADRMRAAGINALGIIAESELAVRLREYPFVIVPAGMLDGSDTNPGVAYLSLPGRILFAAAASNCPVIILGSTETCGARVVRHWGIGDVVPYDPELLSAAMDRLSAPEYQQGKRRHAARIAPKLSAAGVGQWLDQSIECGRAADSRFSDLFADYDATVDLARLPGADMQEDAE